MNRPITANELFHFTNFENLLGIIENGFYPRYNLEYTFLSDIFHQRPAALSPIPMVCFCDIPLYLVEEHSGKYGKCAIGFKKEWGYRKGLNPVIYLPPNSKLGDAFSALANSFNNYHSSNVPNLEIVVMITQALKSSSHLSCFLKQYERVTDQELYINEIKHVFPKGRFYDEREWRYVPFDKKYGNMMVINSSDLLDENKRNAINANLHEYKLNFELSDITNIVFETEKQKQEILTKLTSRFKCSEDTIIENIDICSYEYCLQ